ncbi:MAG: ATP synthase F1 subunit delta [Actinobacteria bacterium]|nr:ATP synthase F1 subunit delta [Actinomycetota bacterium]
MAVAERVYARALFDAAQNQERLEPVREELAYFVESTRDVPELRALMLNPQLDPRAKVSALEGLLEDADELVRNFVLVVTERGRGGELEDMQREFERLAAAESGQLDVELTTAFELSDEDAARILEQIERASGRSVQATRKVDPSLIGGVVLRAGSQRVDASVRGRLEKLRQELKTRRSASRSSVERTSGKDIDEAST